jgi:hypothetical protein
LVTEPVGAPPASAPARRRIDAPEPPPPGRRGCLWLGAIAGIVVGAFFALFAMGPILNHFFGEANIALGEAYDIRGLRIEVVDVREAEARGDTLLHVALAIELDEDRDEPFRLRNNRWTVKFDDNHQAGPRGFLPESTPEEVQPGESVRVEILFPANDHPHYLYLSNPEARFDLEPSDGE